MFGAGFIFGTLRVLALEPNLGKLAAVMVELPIMMTVCWRLSRGYGLPTNEGFNHIASLKLAVVAFLTLLVCELAMLVIMFDQTWSSALDELILSTRPESRIGLAGQVLCSFFPYIDALRPPPKHVKE